MGDTLEKARAGATVLPFAPTRGETVVSDEEEIQRKHDKLVAMLKEAHSEDQHEQIAKILLKWSELQARRWWYEPLQRVLWAAVAVSAYHWLIE